MKEMGILYYVKSVFRLKYNLIGLAWFFIAGIVTTPRLFWPIGIALEILFLAILSTNKRFQRTVDAQLSNQKINQVENRKNFIISNLLTAERKKRFNDLIEKCKNL